MTKYEYISVLEKHLAPMPYAEKIKMLDFYREMIEDKIESGKTEEEVIAEMGDVGSLADRLLTEYRNVNSESETEAPPVTKRQPMSGGVKALIIIAIILCSPIIISITAAVASVVFAIAIAGLSIGVAFVAAAVGIGIAGIAVFATSFMHIGGNFFAFLLQLGASFLMIALCMLLIAGGIGFIKLLVLFIKAITDAVRSRKIKREAN